MSNQYPSPNPSDPSYPSQVPPYQGNPYQGGTYPRNPYQQRAGGPQMPASPVPQPPSYQSPTYRSPQAPAYPAPGAFPPAEALSGNQMPASAPNRQQVPTAETPEEAARFKRKWVTYTVIFLIALVPLFFIIMIGNSFEFGEERLYWIVITSAVEFLFALGFFPFSAAVRRGIRQVTAQGKLEEAEKRRTGLYLSALIAVVVAGYALYNGVPAAMDVADGQQSVTVTSCSYEQHKTEKRRGRHSSTTVYDNVFTFTLDDGTTHHTTLERYYAEDITHEGGLPGVLYEACSRRSGSASLSMMVYRNTWIIVEARIK
ncbi:hypothetical protein [uncultured Actinomyces sp.]|uniref:hypothetical protein n=1 Tax=uncultured Actinomyces sp. TaxID=249061 RepID=UPI0028E22A7F|nr:hypothetical protein [uncultured Actinomyces sp.]